MVEKRMDGSNRGYHKGTTTAPTKSKSIKVEEDGERKETKQMNGILYKGSTVRPPCWRYYMVSWSLPLREASTPA
jgi:hypothetical protein